MKPARPERWTALAALAMTGLLGFYLLAPDHLASLLRTYGWLRQVASLILARAA
ncbi:MAG: hypothetical protein NTY23_08125 [Chloroflexi bacterium]|nr:hypothetical protein [Chloroflexota bacterium]